MKTRIPIPEAAKALAKRSKAPRREDTSRSDQTTAGVGHNRGPPIVLDASPARDAPIARAALTIDEFCTSHGVSKPMLYKLWKQGLGPKFMLVGMRRYISTKAAAAWRESPERQASSAKARPELERRSRLGLAIGRGQTKAERASP
jgi:hypothetical protein